MALPRHLARTTRQLPDEVKVRALQVEAARRQIPINLYLNALHTAICTGVFPVIDPQTGKIDLTQGTEITTDQRIESTRFLLDLAIPHLKRKEAPEPDPTPEAIAEVITNGSTSTKPEDATTHQDIRALTTQQIEQVLKALDEKQSKTPSAATTP